jgi:hypothetical protein
VTRFQFAHFCTNLERFEIAFDGLLDRLQKLIVLERLRQKFNGSRFYRLDA